jgi:ketosteroid isomerase-like protein
MPAERRAEPEPGAAGAPSPEVAVVRRAHDVLNRGDVEALIALCDPGFQLDMSDRVLNPAVYEGHDGIRRFYAEVTDVWERFTWEPTALHEFGELIVARLHSRGRGRGSGLELDRQSAMVWRVRGGRALSVAFFRDPNRAMAVARSHARAE